MTKTKQIEKYFNDLSTYKRTKNRLNNINITIAKITKSYIIIKIDNIYYMYKSIPQIEYDIIYTRIIKNNGCYINFSKTIANLNAKTL